MVVVTGARARVMQAIMQEDGGRVNVEAEAAHLMARHAVDRAWT